MSPSSPRLLFSTAAFFGQPLRVAFRNIAEAGFTRVEVMVTRDPASQDPWLIEDLAAEFGLAVDAIHAPFLLLTRRVWGTDPVTKIYRAVQVAEHVGASLVVAHPPYRWQLRYRRWIEGRAAELETTTRITIGVENMFPVRVAGERAVRFHAPSQQLHELERFPHIVLDTSHAAVAGLDLLDAFERLRGRLVHVHLSDNAGRGWDSHLPLEEGVLPIADLLGRIAEDRFGGSIALELDLRRYMEDAGALRDVMIRQRTFCEARLPLRA